MTQDEDNITTMFETTNGVLDDNNATWNAMPAFVDAVGRGKAGTAALRQRQEDQAKTGAAGSKQNARDAVEAATLVIGSQLSALAAKTDNPDLAAKVALDKSTLDRMAVSDLIAAAKRVKKAADDNASVLDTDYKIKAADVTAFDTAITALDELKDAPRAAVVNRKVATMSIPEGIRFVRGIYRNEIDKMMEAFKSSAPDFYAAYFTARMIIDRSGTHKPAKPTTPPSTP